MRIYMTRARAIWVLGLEVSFWGAGSIFQFFAVPRKKQLLLNASKVIGPDLVIQVLVDNYYKSVVNNYDSATLVSKFGESGAKIVLYNYKNEWA